MDENMQLKILKMNLQLLTNAQDEYLKKLLKQAVSLIKREGIQNDHTEDYEMSIIDYAAFLFRKRANNELTMPRHLRYELNNILMSQKSK